MTSGVELTPEELALALSQRPRVPLTWEQQKGLLEMLAWFEQQQEIAEARRLRMENRWKRIPVIFGVTGSLIGMLSAIAAWFLKKP